MIAPHLPWLLLLIGAITILAGLAALLPSRALGWMLPLDELTPAGWFFVRHWGVLVAVCGGLLLWAARDDALRNPILFAVGLEKAAFVFMVFLRRGTLLGKKLVGAAVGDLLACVVLAGAWLGW